MDGIGQALLVTAALSALGIVVSLVAVLVRAVALQRSIARFASGTLVRDAALADARKHTRWMRTLVLEVVTLGPLLTFLIPWSIGKYAVDPHLWPGVYAVVLSITVSIYEVLGIWLIGLRVMRALRGLAPTTAETVVSTIKGVLLTYLPFMLICVGLSLTFASGWALGVWLLCLIAVVWSSATVLFRGHLFRLINPTRSIQSSAAPELQDRLARWAARCGVRPPDVRVLSTANVGVALITEMGAFDRTLFISDNALVSMDWRQRDAFIVRALHGAKSAGVGATLLISLYVFTYGLIGFALTTPTTATDPATASIIAVFLLFGLSSVIGILARQRGTNQLRLDRLAAEVTGDPLAIMVGMNTLTTLNGASGELSNAGLQLTPLGDRMRALDAWMQQPGPRAPWAYQPVPSRWPVTVGTYLLTAPLESAPPPVPVPPAPYPSVAPAAFVPVAP
ncbi:MAG: hypothetical protein ACHQ4H_18695 [Ktedonobacterales bacterium]